ncbi:MAG: hypothetical protein A2898_03355 [Candidatus Kerfeldbacteria bacterium RIFCSPLOWO2_01_FULL_48_11]|uniref:Uncharacterized protein n=1 Tax=Candidatus Kerfeldbacteria bacterium RIFCSPLOWO2_01_FULL_48_11 TaxID=1798543 RepID=A0A1G2B272_9BACT|nr:MAG: hypothetical protein UY34_C0009G0018 [Parcubacteria group bacterium GW2011_GWA2_48_9]OGY83301.1 MAG: hypothetical protein A2898_03355 [Candidatus Kerfeldbacteria bacterium RIFCSPLOWO2_01_FULL_48_11]HCJ52246.1 hypothetical protein [Candidatus Kerfeldbacteria bacterium]HCM67580.1 hypothetical protein [Candidatus Kerfeldbacteria bacterium]
MKKHLIAIIIWLAAMAGVYFAYYNRAITEYRKIDPVTGEEYGEMGYYTDWGQMAMAAVVATVVIWGVYGLTVWRGKNGYLNRATVVFK